MLSLNNIFLKVFQLFSFCIFNLKQVCRDNSLKHWSGLYFRDQFPIGNCIVYDLCLLKKKKKNYQNL